MVSKSLTYAGSESVWISVHNVRLLNWIEHMKLQRRPITYRANQYLLIITVLKHQVSKIWIKFCQILQIFLFKMNAIVKLRRTRTFFGYYMDRSLYVLEKTATRFESFSRHSNWVSHCWRMLSPFFYS